VQFAQIIHGQPSGSGIPSTYVYSGGLNPPSDIAGLHLAQSPSGPVLLFEKLATFWLF
jgi:N-acetylmuramoyl-L-alanine amidase